MKVQLYSSGSVKITTQTYKRKVLLMRNNVCRMMKLIIWILFSFPILYWDVHCHYCSVNNVNLTVLVNCSYQGLKLIPRDLPKTVTSLDLSYNDLRQLPCNAFDNYPMLQSLNINNNYLNSTDVDALTGLKNLFNLSMSKNSLQLNRDYPNGIFRFLKSLKILDIRWNLKGSKDGDSEMFYPYFGDLVVLSDLYMDLSTNPNFMKSGLAQLQNLRVVRFDDCSVKNLSGKTFENFPEGIQELYFHNFKKYGPSMTVTSNDVLKRFKQLQVLSLNNIVCKLSEALGLLYPFVNKSMDAIIFRKVRSVDELSVFLTMSMTSYLRSMCVKTLVLAQDWIADFEPDALFGFTYPECLENVAFSGNRFALLSDTKASAFIKLVPNLKQLRLFDFSFNPLEYSNVWFLDIPYFQHALGEKKSISTESHTIFYNDNTFNFANSLQATDQDRKLQTMGNLQNIQLSKNTNPMITDLPYITIDIPRNIEVLRISHIMTTEALINKKMINVQNALNLRILDTSYTPIEKIKGVQFIGGVNIEYLDISGSDSNIVLAEYTLQLFENTTTIIMRDANLGATFKEKPTLFSQFVPKVEKLDISRNNIWFINEQTFTKSPNLTDLNLSQNFLPEIPRCIFSISTLDTLDLRYNLLQTINTKMQTWFDNQVEITNTGSFRLFIHGNDFLCNCDTRDFIQWLFRTNVDLDRKDRKYICRLKNGTKSDMNKVYYEFHDLFRNCDSVTWLQIGIFSVVLFLSIIVILSFIHKFKWHILYWFYKKFKTVIANEIDKTFKYDIYLSYAVDSTSWVKSSFVPTIEQSWKMTLCIQERDLLGGEVFADSVAAAIKESRIFICIISEEFKNREWGTYEIERAKYEKFTKNMQKLVIIIKGASIADFPIEQFENAWKDIVIIDWPKYDNEKGWNELRVALFSESF